MPSSVSRLTADLGRPHRPVEQRQQGIPSFSVPLLPRPRLTELIDRATRHKVVLVRGPAGAGKTVACAQWTAAPSGGRQVVWLTLRAGEDESWFWADVYARLKLARLMPRGATAYLAEASTDGFPFRLAEIARQLTAPLVLVLDNAHALSDTSVVAGLDVLISHAPPNLCLLLSGRQAPGIRLDRLRASGELATVGPADLACTSDEADAYLAMPGSGRSRAARRQRVAWALGMAAPPARGEAPFPRTWEAQRGWLTRNNPPPAVP